MEPAWLIEARKHLDQKEVPGPKSNKWILSLWDTVPWIWSTVARVDDSILAWCGAFIRFCLVNVGINPPKKWWAARSYVGFGHRTYYPVVGAIGVVRNHMNKYHVGIIVGKNNAGNIVMIGGNQSDAVKLSAFVPSAFVYYGWPGRLADIPYAGQLPVLSASLSDSEA